MQRLQITVPARVGSSTARWPNGFLDGGIALLQKDASRLGRPPTVLFSKVKRIVDRMSQPWLAEIQAARDQFAEQRVHNRCIHRSPEASFSATIVCRSLKGVASISIAHIQTRISTGT
jgi:hypothetical protein